MIKGGMFMLKRVAVFFAAFAFIACVLTVISAAVCEEPSSSAIDPTDGAAEYPNDATNNDEKVAEKAEEPTGSADEYSEQDTLSYTPRLSAPSYDNACYYSDDNAFYAASYGMPNCTCYAWGRAYELLGEKPELCLYDAGYWYDYNRTYGIYDYGDEPEPGAIACWAYADGGPGHVAVVESVDSDTVTFSNSAYQGAEFYVSDAPVSDPSCGMPNWLFQGYIYVDRYV